MAARKRKWIQAARKSMEKRGTVGSYGKSTAKKDARNIAKGGRAAKKAVFAQNMRRAAAKRKRKRSSGRR